MKQKGCALQLVRHETKGRTLRVGIDLHSQCVRYMNKRAHSWGGSGMSLRFVTALVQENLGTAPFPVQHAYDKFMNAQQNLLVYCQPFLHKRCCVILLLYPC